MYITEKKILNHVEKNMLTKPTLPLTVVSHCHHNPRTMFCVVSNAFKILEHLKIIHYGNEWHSTKVDDIKKNPYGNEWQGVVRIRKSKDRQQINQKKRDKRTNNDLQNITQKTKDRTTRTPLKQARELRCSGRECNSCSTSGTLKSSHWLCSKVG
jgi:hypothetical protein